jgi:hypothetical protein
MAALDPISLMNSVHQEEVKRTSMLLMMHVGIPWSDSPPVVHEQASDAFGQTGAASEIQWDQSDYFGIFVGDGHYCVMSCVGEW